VRALWDLVGVDLKQAPKADAGFSMVRKKVESSPRRKRRKKEKAKKGTVKARKTKR
jgi:hypothetical protein